MGTDGGHAKPSEMGHPRAVHRSLHVSLCCLLFACGLNQEPPRTAEGVVREMREADRILDLRANGEEIDEETLFAALRTVSVVYLGERHDEPLDHSMQQRVLRGLLSHDPSLAVGLEMVQHPYQRHLDDWVAGNLDENALKARVEWDSRWGHDFALYRPIFELARSRQLPMVALNARTEVTRAVGRGGLESLSESHRAEVPELDLSDTRHREMVLAAMGAGAHHGDPDHLYAAQVIWDETMASHVAGVMRAGTSRMVVLAGAMHLRGGLGIPRRAARRGAEPFKVVLTADHDADIEAIVAERPAVADYLWVHAPR